jgi:C1A family cysteine protease
MEKWKSGTSPVTAWSEYDDIKYVASTKYVNDCHNSLTAKDTECLQEISITV